MLIRNALKSTSAWVCCVGLLLMASACNSDNENGTPGSDSGTTNQTGDLGLVIEDGTVTNGDSSINTSPDASSNDKDGGITSDNGSISKTDANSTPTCNPDFGANEACGGNVVGTWKYVSACHNGELYDTIKICKGAELSNELISSTGTLTLKSDLTFSRKANGTATVDGFIPASCAYGLNCQEVAETYQTLISGSTITCTDGATSGSCNCKFSIPLTTDDAGTYTTQGGIITAKTSAGKNYQYYYCVKDNVFMYKGLSSNTLDKKLTYVLIPQ